MKELLYKKIFSSVKAVVLAFALLVLMVPVTASAAEIKISATGGTIETGQTITVTLNLSSSATIGAYRFYLTYDSSVVEYVPSDGDANFCNGGNGTLIFVGDPYAKSDSCSIKFKGVSAGSSKLTVSYDAGDILDSDYNDMTVSASSGTITVNAPREASTDATLKSLTVGEGSLSPAFSSGGTSYSMSVGADVDKLTINAKANSEYAKVAISGNSLKEGANAVKIVVTAESGATKTYTINVEKAKATPTPSPEPTNTPTPTPTPTPGVEVSVNKLTTDADGNVSQVAETLTVSDEITVNVPDGFELTGVTVQGVAVEALKLNDGNLILVQLSDDKLYVYDSVNKTFEEYQTIDTASRHFRISMAPVEEIPAGYSLTTVKIGNTTYPAYRISAEDEFVLVYAEGSIWYKYDTVEGTIQRYDESEDKIVVVTATPMPTATPGPTNEPTGTTPVSTPASANPGDKQESNTMTIIKLVIIIVVFLLAILFMILYVRERNRNLSYIADEESFYEEEEEDAGVDVNPGVTFEDLGDAEPDEPEFDEADMNDEAAGAVDVDYESMMDEFALVDDTEDYAFDYSDEEV